MDIFLEGQSFIINHYTKLLENKFYEKKLNMINTSIIAL